MKMSAEGYQQCYNVQAAVVGGHQLVAATEVTSNASDRGRCRSCSTRRRSTWRAPGVSAGGPGHCNESDLAELESRGVDAYVAPGRDGKAAARNAERHPATCRMIEKLGTPEGRARYAERKWLSEAPNGWI